jgi:hypothetical protein
MNTFVVFIVNYDIENMATYAPIQMINIENDIDEINQFRKREDLTVHQS